MKVFKNYTGQIYDSTLTVAEMMEKLSHYPPDLPVMAEWDGINTCFDFDGFEVKFVTYGDSKNFECLVIDVNSLE